MGGMMLISGATLPPGRYHVIDDAMWITLVAELMARPQVMREIGGLKTVASFTVRDDDGAPEHG